MEGLGVLFLLSLAMFLGCWLAGLVPLSFNLPESRLRLVTIFGAGLLVGTALAVIIPEGVAAIYQTQTDPHSPESHSHSAHVGTHEEDTRVPSAAGGPVEGILDNAAGPVVKKLGQLPDKPPGIHAVPDEKSPADEEHKRQKRSSHNGHFGHSHDSGSDPHSFIGFALVSGFVFMLFVDQIASMGPKRDPELGVVQPRYKITATIGLVVHAAADGIALGAASSTKQSEIQFIVFVAIMLHKAPAAFGLATFLLYEGLDRSRIKKHLLVFALAAPFAALATFIGIAQGGSERLSSLSTTGLLMLFSAGTFLYVATVHVLPEIVHSGSPSESSGMGHSHAAGTGFRLNELAALAGGALVPAFLTLGHSH